MKQLWNYRLPLHVQRTKLVVFVSKLLSKNLEARNVSEFYRIVIIFSVFNAFENGDNQNSSIIKSFGKLIIGIIVSFITPHFIYIILFILCISSACPECRVTSDFVCPSPLWVDTKDEKDKLIKEYLVALEEKNCKYFKQGQAKCPFGNKCFYKHALPNGVLVDVGLPQRPPRRHNHLGEISGFQVCLLYIFKPIA